MWIASGLQQATIPGTDLLARYSRCFLLIKKAAMYPISSLRTSTISVRNDRFNKSIDTRNAAYRTARFEGHADLLLDTILEEVLDQPGLDVRQNIIVQRALVDGFFPSGQSDCEDTQFFADWLVRHKQAKLLCLWLESTPLSIRVLDNEIAAGLLAIVQSTLSFAGLRLEILSFLETNDSKDVVPLLGKAFQSNASLRSIAIFLQDYEAAGLSPLFDVLAGVAGLELVIGAAVMAPTDFSALGKLLSLNKTLRVLELEHFCSRTSNHGEAAQGTGSAAHVIGQIAGQLQLERLELNYIPPQCQSVIGQLMCTSHALKELKVAFDGTKVDAAVIEGFSRTKSVEKACLSVASFEEDMLDFVISIAKNNVSIKTLELRARNPREDICLTSGICSLIGENRSLASLTCFLPDGCKLDLAKIGAALGKNVRLETLMLLYKAQSNHSGQPDWIDETSMSALAGKLKQNRTLTELVLASEDDLFASVKKNYAVLQQVLDRNSAYQRYACSDAFLYGAVVEFFLSVNLPADPAMLTARELMHDKPRTGVAALALVNKQGYSRALFSRHQAHANVLDHLLPITKDLVVNNRKEMIELLYGVIVTNADFSNAELCRIAESETLPGALVAIMFRNPQDYLYLIKLFCQAVGVTTMRSRVIRKIAKDDTLDAIESAGTGHDFLLSMLEQSFSPDQKHLLPFVEKELIYDDINSTAVKLFVGYDIPKINALGSQKPQVASWCLENRQPGVLMAFYDAFTSKVSIDFSKYSGSFARSMMEKISQLNNARILSIKGIPDYEDALVLCRVLAGTSILKQLHIDRDYCGQEFDAIMQGLSLNHRIKRLYLSPRTMPEPPAICDTLASLLEANGTIELIEMTHFDNDPELPGLTLLAENDARLTLDELEYDE